MTQVKRSRGIGLNRKEQSALACEEVNACVGSSSQELSTTEAVLRVIARRVKNRVIIDSDFDSLGACYCVALSDGQLRV